MPTPLPGTPRIHRGAQFLAACTVLVSLACGPPIGETSIKDQSALAADKHEGENADPAAYGEGPPMPSNKPAGGGGPSVNEKDARSHDVYDKESTDVVLSRAGRQVKENCGAAADQSGTAPGPWGKLTVVVKLGHNGHSKGVTVPEPYTDTPAGRCITQAFKNLTFPPWAGSDTDVDWEVELVKPATAGGKKK